MSDEEAAGSGSGSPSFGRPGRRKSLEEVIMDEEVEVAAAAVRAEEEAKAAALLPPVYTAEEAARKQELPIEPGALVLYLLFVVTFTVVAVSTRDWRFGYRYGEAMKSTLLETEFDTADTEIYKTFHDVTTLTDVWWYLQGPLIGALYSETSYTGQPLPPERLRFVNDNNKLLGKVRLQQVRVAPNVGCRVADWAASNSSAAYVSECYPEWSEVRFSRHDRAPIVVNARGPQECAKADGSDGDEPAIACETQTYEWVSRRGTGLAPFRGWLYWYDGSGYMLELPNDYTAARTLLAQLRADDWLGAPTRALWVDFSVYNANINRFCVVRLLFERLHNGGVMPYAQVCDDPDAPHTAHGPHSLYSSPRLLPHPPPQVRSLHLLWYARSDWLLVLIPECTLMLLVVYVT